MKSFDVLLDKIKPLGRYQLLYTMTYGIYAMIASPFSLFLPMFVVFFGPEHHCVIPQTLRDTAPAGLNDSELLSKLTPINGNSNPPEPDHCRMRDLSQTNWTYIQGNLSELPTVACPEGTEYSTSKWNSHLVSKLGMICDKRNEATNTLTLSSVGAAVGSLLLAHAQDHLGRKPCLVFSYAWTTISCLLLMFVPSIPWLKTALFMLGIQQRLSFPLPVTYCQEMTNIANQALVYTILAVSFAFGCLLLALVNYLATSWTTVVACTVGIHAVAIIPSLFIDESARWLITAAKLERAKKVVQNMIRTNQVVLEKSELAQIETLMESASQEEKEKKVESYAFWTLYTNGWSLAIKITVVSIAQIAAMMIYEGLTINMENFNANPYLIFAVTSTVEIPAGLMTLTANYVGRIPVAFWAYFASGAFSIGTIFVNTMGNTALLVFFVFVTKLSITLAWDVQFLMVQEQFPTIVRGTAFGICALASVLFSIAVPTIVYRGLTDFRIPLITFAALAFFGGFLVLVLPETAGKPLIDSLDEEKQRPITKNTIRKNITLYYARSRRKVGDFTPDDHPGPGAFSLSEK